jgi:rhodanese-related sulfurtransferase
MLHQTLKDAEETGAVGYGGVEDARALVQRFPDQPLDFFAAARAMCADDAVRDWLAEVGSDPERVRAALVGRRGAAEACEERSTKPFVLKPRQDVSLPALLRAAARVAAEQQHVLDVNLAREYVNAWTEDLTTAEIRQRRRADAARARAPEARNVLDAFENERAEKRKTLRADAEARALAETNALAKSNADYLLEVSAEAARRGLTTAIEIGVSTRSDAEKAAVLEAEAERVCESERAWDVWDCVECYRARKENPKATLFVDVRPKKAFLRETVKGAINCPAAVTRGTVAEPVTEKDVDGAVAALRSSAAFSKKALLKFSSSSATAAATAGTPGTLFARFTT